MIVHAPWRGFAGLGSAGLGDASWVSQWLNAGYNDDGRVLTFIRNQPDQADGVNPVSMAKLTGRWIPWGGYAQTYGPAGRPYPFLRFGLPSDEDPYPSGLVNMLGPVPAGFISPGDDAMRAAIEKWIGLDFVPAAAGAAPFSQAVPVIGGQTAEQAAAIQAINEQALASIVAQQTAPAASASPAASPVGAASSFLTALFPPASSQPAGSSVSSIPTWAWAVGAVAVLYFAFGGSHGR